MAKKKIKINPKKFTQDFRSGMSDDELMLAHGLTPMALEKVIRMMEEKHLLDVAEISRDITVPTMRHVRSGRGNRPRPIAEESTVLTPLQRFPDEPLKEPGSKCPQCGAGVPETALTCRECGHVLPGSHRWEEPESDESLWKRLPPIVRGCVVAAPFLLIFFLLLTYVVLPAGESRIDKRIELIRQQGPRKTASAPVSSRGESNPQGGQTDNLLDLELENQIADGILTEVGQDLSFFRAGARWTQLSEQELAEKMARIAAALRQARFEVYFQVVDTDGWTVAECTETSVRIFKDGRATDWQFDQLSSGPEVGSGEKKQ